MTTPTTPETLLAEAIRLNSERTPGSWRVEIFTGKFGEWLERVFSVENDDFPDERTDICSTENIGGNVSDQMHDIEFIANAPAVYDAYIAQAKVVQELVGILKQVDEEFMLESTIDGYWGSELRNSINEALKKAGGVMSWQDTADKLPDPEKKVLVFCWGDIFTGFIHKVKERRKGEEWIVIAELGIRFTDKVTHWQPLPEAPTADSKPK